MSNAATTMALQTDRIIQRLNSCQARLDVAEYRLGGTSSVSNQTRQDTDGLLIHADRLQDAVNYLLDLQPSGRLTSLERRSTLSEANITELHRVDNETMDRTSALEATSANHESRIIALEELGDVLTSNVSTLQYRADVAHGNITELERRQDEADVAINVLTVNMTRSMNVIVLLEELATDGLMRIGLLETYTVPRYEHSIELFAAAQARSS